MKIRNIDKLRFTERDVKFNAGNSIRFLLEKDGMGFSFHQTEMKKILNEKQFEDWKTLQQKNRKGDCRKSGKKGGNKNQSPQNNK